MKLTLKELILSVGQPQMGKPGPLSKLLNDSSLPVTISFRLARILKQLNPILDAYEESRIKLCEKYGTKTEFGDYDFGDQREAFSAEGDELVSEVLEIQGDKFLIEEISNRKITADGNFLSATDFLTLDWLFVMQEIEPAQPEVKAPKAAKAGK